LIDDDELPAHRGDEVRARKLERACSLLRHKPHLELGERHPELAPNAKL